MEQRVMLMEDDVFELLAFLVTSARLCVDEPKLYGTFRLVDAASRLLGFKAPSPRPRGRRRQENRVESDSLLHGTPTRRWLRAFCTES